MRTSSSSSLTPATNAAQQQNENNNIQNLDKTQKNDSSKHKRRSRGAIKGYTRYPIKVRAHCNPLSDENFDVPASPAAVNWEECFPTSKNPKTVNMVDIGCAYGGLICSLSSLLPDKNILGIEIRMKVTEYTQGRIKRLRSLCNTQEGDEIIKKIEKKKGKESVQTSNAKKRLREDEDKDEDKLIDFPINYTPKNDFSNVWAIRSNAMKYLPNFFYKGQLEKMTFCFPDPHFKKRNCRKRIISKQLLAEYAYFLKVGGLLYTITDVEDLGNWMRTAGESHPLFKKVDENELLKNGDVVMDYIMKSSEDAQRTIDKKLNMYIAIFERINDPQSEE